MTHEDIRDAILATLHRIAPEVELASIAGDRPLRDQIDLDSMDALNLMIGVSERLAVDIPEADYGRVATIDQFVRYLAERTATPASRAT